jgi:hypothetical protein
MTADDPDGLVTELGQFWRRIDPMPTALLDRLVFTVRGLAEARPWRADQELRLLRCSELELVGGGVRAEEAARTITFSSDSISVLLTVNQDHDQHRLDGWIDGGKGRVLVELRRDESVRSVDSDADGRFYFDQVPSGLIQLSFRLDGGELTVVTPGVQI